MRRGLATVALVAALVFAATAQQSSSVEAKKAPNSREAATGQSAGKAADVKSPRDAATGQASGKATTQNVKSPRDAATGQASGKRTATQGGGSTAAPETGKSEPK